MCAYTDSAPASLVAEHMSMHLREIEHRASEA